MARPRGLAKTGGRQRGTPNRKTHELAEKLEGLGCDPIEGLAKIAMDAETAPELKVRCSGVQIAALREIADRTEGKPRQAIQVDASFNSTLAERLERGRKRVLERTGAGL